MGLRSIGKLVALMLFLLAIALSVNVVTCDPGVQNFAINSYPMQN